MKKAIRQLSAVHMLCSSLYFLLLLNCDPFISSGWISIFNYSNPWHNMIKEEDEEEDKNMFWLKRWPSVINYWKRIGFHWNICQLFYELKSYDDDAVQWCCDGRECMTRKESVFFSLTKGKYFPFVTLPFFNLTAIQFSLTIFLYSCQTWKNMKSEFQGFTFLQSNTPLDGKHFLEVIKNLEISLFADYIKFDPQTFD